jgi:hypothetical protein
VVNHKKVFFTGYANYEACHTGGLRLLPDQRLLEAVGNDLRAMIDAGMFYGERPSFDRIVERLQALEREINAAAA